MESERSTLPQAMGKSPSDATGELLPKPDLFTPESEKISLSHSLHSPLICGVDFTFVAVFLLHLFL